VPERTDSLAQKGGAALPLQPEGLGLPRRVFVMSLARMRVRGILALVAGAILLMGVPVYQALVLAPRGYLAVAASIAAGGDFGRYLLWAGMHTGADVGFRIVELSAFVLATSLPGPLRRILWPDDPQGGRRAMLAGQTGFLLFAGVLVAGIVIVSSAAHAYVADPAHRAATQSSYKSLFAVETLLAKVLAGALIALSLALLSARGLATGRLPGWFAYLGLVAAGLLGTTALLALLDLTRSSTPTDTFAFSILAIWLLALGILLVRIQSRPRQASASAVREAAGPPH
jgi:hypothetical protein